MELPNKKAISFESKTPWRSISCIAVLTLCAMVQFTLFFSSCWPYLMSLDSQTTENFYGMVVAAYSAGQMIGSPLFGFWSNRIKNVRIPIAAGIFVSFVGNLVYISALLAPTGAAKWLVLVGRFVVGFGGSNVAVMRSYASMASVKADRSRAIALINGGYALGSTLGPCFQLLFTPLGYPGVQIAGRLFASTYTAPAAFACFINAVGLVCLFVFFEERYAGLVDKSELQTNGDEKKKVIPRYDVLAVFIVHLVTFSQRFSFTNLETVSGPMGTSVFAWTKEEIVKNIALAHGAVSFFTLLVNLAYFLFKMEKILDFRIQCLVGLGGLLAFHLLTFSWPFLPGSLQTYDAQEFAAALANGTEITGCNRDRFSWCDDVRPVNVWLYYGAYVFFIGCFYPSIQVTINVLFSHILGPRRMGGQQGLLQVTSSSGRLIGPLLLSNLYTSFGPRFAWYMEFLVLGATIAFFLFFFRRMVPLELPPEITSLSTIQIQPLGVEKLSVSSFATGSSLGSQSNLSDSGDSTHQTTIHTTRTTV